MGSFLLKYGADNSFLIFLLLTSVVKQLNEWNWKEKSLYPSRDTNGIL